MPETLLSVRGLEAGYGTKLILRGVDFAIDRGEVVTLLGANGSGKSTALNTVSGFVRPTRGSIVLAGEEIAGLPPHLTFRRGVVQVSQARDLFLDLSVDDNLRLGSAVRGDKATLEDRLRNIYRYFPRLLERRAQRARTLSGGEQQMVAVARALLAEPTIMLLDEPSGGLSPQFMKEIGAIMRRLKEAGTTMLLVEQNIGLALDVADRFIILRDGVVIQGGSVEALREAKEDIVKTVYL